MFSLPFLRSLVRFSPGSLGWWQQCTTIPLTHRVNPSACVRVGGEHSHSYPGTTIGGIGGSTTRGSLHNSTVDCTVVAGVLVPCYFVLVLLTVISICKGKVVPVYAMNMNFTTTERGSGTHQIGGWASPRPGFEMFTGKKNILLLLEIKP